MFKRYTDYIRVVYYYGDVVRCIIQFGQGRVPAGYCIKINIYNLQTRIIIIKERMVKRVPNNRGSFGAR